MSPATGATGWPGAPGEIVLPGGSGCAGFPGQEALPAVDGAPLRRLEGHGGLAAALRAGGHGFRLGEAAAGTPSTLAFRLARLATFGFVFEVFVVEEMLLARCKDKLRSAVAARKDSILELRHINCAP